MPTFNITISPSQTEFILKPGVTLLQAYNITNNSDTSIVLNSEILPWIPSGTDGSVNYNQAISNPNIEFSLANSDLKIGQPFIIAANSKQQLVLKIKSDPSTGLSDNYYTFFVFQNQKTTESKDNFTKAVGKIGSHLLLTVSDTENPKIESKIENFSISPKIKDVFFRSINFNGVVKNNSNFFFKINGKISLDPSLNAKSYDTSFYVLPISPLLFMLLAAGFIFGIKKFKNKKISQ